jgi:DNA-binding MarR family transcriptional regulator
MIAERIDFEVGYKELERAAGAILHGDRKAAIMWLDELGEHVEKVADGGRLEPVAEWSARLDRLTANLPDGEWAELARGYLLHMLHQLDRSAAMLSQQRDVEEREAIAGGVRERVLEFLVARPRSRSGEIAAELRIAPSQASRALRELQERGAVFLSARDAGDRDGRVHRYEAAAAVSASVPAAASTQVA